MFRGYEPDRDRLVAIKVFKLDLPPERVHQFVAELERVIAAGLTRSGIAAPLAAGIADNTPYLVQEFVAADSLDVLVRDYGPAPPADGLQVAVQLAGALDFAAVVNVVHGALHPRDLLLSTDESRMTGLGVARALERIGVTPPVRPPYSAPERIAGRAWDRRADIFSLAAIVFEMLWGRRVHGTGTHAVGGLTELPGADLAALRTTLARALAEKPEARFETALEFAAALRQGFPGITAVESRRSIVESRQSTVESRQSTVDSRQSAAGPVLLDPPPPNTATPIQAHAPTDAELRSGEESRYRDVESGPAIIAPGLASLSATQPGGVLGLEQPHTHESALDRTRSALWPLVLALIVGLALGFAGGYGVGNRERALASAATPIAFADTQPVPAAQPAPTTGREFTEGAVSEAPTAASTDGSTHDATGTPPPSGSRPAPAATNGTSSASADTGRLLVRSTPAGAHVLVDGRERGRTPVTIRDLARGTHRVRVVQDGYAGQDRRVTLTRSKPSQSVSVALTRARAETPPPAAPPPAPRRTADAPRPVAPESFSGSLSVDSLPAGAKVFVDGKLVGTTPLMLPQVGAGEHVVRIEQDGYRKWSSSVRVVSGERNRVTASLEK